MSSKNVIGSLPKAEFEWLVKLPDKILAKSVYLDSPTFLFSHASWFVRMHPKGYEASEYISLYLWKKDTQSEINVQYSLEMILNGVSLKKLEATSTFGKHRNWGWRTYLLRSKVPDLDWPWERKECSQLTIKIRMSDNVPPEKGILLGKRKEGPNPNVTPNFKKSKSQYPFNGPELGAFMKLGTRVVKWGDQGEGTVVRELSEDGWIYVRWDTGPKYEKHRMGFGQYELNLAHPLPDSLPDSVDENGEDNATPKLSDVYNMCQDLRQFLLTEEGSDVTLQVQDQQFEAHRFILMARSSVFAAMFHHDTKEKATGVVIIEDCEPSSFPVLLEFIYCCSTEKLSVENVFDLYTSADKYDIKDLKTGCLEFIKKNLSVKTFCETFKLALQHPESNLVDMVVEFFAENMKDIIVTVKWQAFLAENPVQCNELLIKALAHQQQKPIEILL